jgi:hypothetical protein
MHFPKVSCVYSSTFSGILIAKYFFVGGVPKIDVSIFPCAEIMYVATCFFGDFGDFGDFSILNYYVIII